MRHPLCSKINWLYVSTELPRVRWVLPVDFIHGRDHYYTGDIFVDGKVLHRPKFPWVGVPNSNHRVGGCGDDELWLITVEFGEEPSLKEKIDFYVKTLAFVVGRFFIPSNMRFFPGI
ncbi:hypothetical protein J1N35_045701 [Gossypium stocksii]|uniref:Uncharacterized protein n=1 Tax=Gossypium stocksii TaxID=47602 RepID=A0A9D3UC22_9ROSI|nr:hypothetical protein J1N35_045701 [Gossypium stocksii]